MALKPLWRRMTVGDRLLVSGLILFCVFFLSLRSFRAAGVHLIVEQNNQVTYKLALDTDRVINLDGPLGPSNIVIEDGAVRFIASPCPNQVCIGMGCASKSGDLLACVPNRLLLRITGRSDRGLDYDLITR
ncbi:MAG: NusG domain II-containing protein [Desulfuromonadales bacterium]|nr:NusG domain II-containing protein [Desulfuromonadales bacterium]